MRNPREALRQWFERRPDPRDDEIKRMASDIRGKFEKLFPDEPGNTQHLLIDLSVDQSELLLPSVAGAPPIQVDMEQMGYSNYDYICNLDRGESATVFYLRGNNAGIESVRRKSRGLIFRSEKVMSLRQRGADIKTRRLQALSFGDNIANVLLQIHEEYPEMFIYI